MTTDLESYYADYDEPEEARVDGSEAEREAPCPAHCNGGLVEVHGQETDCITCEGYGTVLA